MYQFDFFRRLHLFALLFATLTFLVACDSAEERAEAHFQAGMALLEEGDVDRALIEFRNVFKLNGRHKEARKTFARLQRERGNTSGSYGQYLRLIEQYPNDLDARRALAEMALETGNWEELELHAVTAAELAPDDIGIKSLVNTLSYSNALRSSSAPEADYAAHVARTLLESDPNLMTARQVIIDHLVRNQDWHDALEEIDAALVIDPGKSGLYAIRLGILRELGRTAEIEAQLVQMADVFPDDEGVKQMLVQHQIEHENLDAAEEFLRAQVDPAAEDYHPVQRLVAFLSEYRGEQVAIAEMDRIIAQKGPSTARYKAMRAVLKFRAGEVDVAIKEMEALLASAGRSPETREIEVEFARLLFQAGNPVGARSLIETILAEDPTQVEALKFKSAWMIEEDEPGEAITLLREALGLAPQDPQLMTLMAHAHERNGDRELMGEMLALAVETSFSAVPESLRYANHLASEGNLTIAESVLIRALRLAPDTPEILAALGQLYLEMEDWSRLETVIRTMDDQEDPDVIGFAKQLRAEMLSAQQRTEDLTAFLTELAGSSDFRLPAEMALVRTMLAQGNISGALARLDTLLEEDPESLPLRYLKALTLANDRKTGAAETLYRSILDDYPDAADVWIALYILLVDSGAPEKAAHVLNEGLETLPENLNLLMLRAASHERAEELDQAIAVYEKLYALNSRSQVVANNLASLLTTHRADDESLQRAFTLARRLRGTRVPAFQDTYGWIAYKLGNHEEALQYLVSAASELPNQPLVLYHLAKTYAALGRNEAALGTFQSVADLVEELETAPDFTPEVLSEIERLQAEPVMGE